MIEFFDDETQIALIRFLGSIIFLIITIGLFWYRKMGLELDMIVSATRGLIQLLILATILTFVFSLSNPILLFAVLSVMIFFGAHTAARRLEGMPSGIKIQLIGLGTAVFFIMIIVSILNIIPIEDPSFWIPIGGMVVGNSMNASYLSVNHLKGEIKNRLEEVETALSLGVSPQQLLVKLNIIPTALRIGIIPRINNLRTLGIVFIPGLMTGLLIGGLNPLAAAFYQIIIFFLIIAGGMIGSVITTYLAVGELFYLEKETIKYQIFVDK